MKASLIIKIVAFQIIFLIFHHLYEWFPGTVTHLLGATGESMFQHMKISVYAYLAFTLSEFMLARQAIPDKINFLISRLFGAVIIAPLMTIYYLVSPAFFVHLNSIVMEILFANIALMATSGSTFLLAGYVEKHEPPQSVKWIVVILFVVVMAESVIFNYRLPWFDIFANPPGW